MIKRSRDFILALLGFTAGLMPTVRAELSLEELAKSAQNPVSEMISLPFQHNTNFNTGPRKGTKNVMNIQPIIPIGINNDWKVVTRTVLPVITQPGEVPGQDSKTGLGDTQFNLFI